jgi:hypothetical protein
LEEIQLYQLSHQQVVAMAADITLSLFTQHQMVDQVAEEHMQYILVVAQEQLAKVLMVVAEQHLVEMMQAVAAVAQEVQAQMVEPMAAMEETVF